MVLSGAASGCTLPPKRKPLLVSGYGKLSVPTASFSFLLTLSKKMRFFCIPPLRLSTAAAAPAAAASEAAPAAAPTAAPPSPSVAPPPPLKHAATENAVPRGLLKST